MKLSKKHPAVITCVLGTVALSALYGILTLNRAIDTYDTRITVGYQNSLIADAVLIDFKTQVQEWKNVLLRGGDREDFDHYWSAFLRSESSVRMNSEMLLSTLESGQAHALVGRFVDAHKSMGVGYRSGLEQFRQSGLQASAADTIVRGIDRKPADLLAKASTLLKEDAALASASAARSADLASTISIAVMLVTSIVSLILAIGFSRSMTRPILEAVDVANRIAAGNLSQTITVRGNDETADLLRALRGMQAQLANVTLKVRKNAESVAASSGDIARTNRRHSEQSESQARALGETSCSVTDLEKLTRENSSRIAEADTLATGAAVSASRGGEAVNAVVETMQGIQDSASRIVDITSVIDDIAFQTNILALNAAVEAARAGDEGRGFAVVASEVRVLAQRSADAAREIKALISESVKHVAEGTDVVNGTGQTMIELVTTIGNVTQIMSQVSEASRYQNEHVAQASRSISAIEQALQENSERIDRSTVAAQCLNQQAENLVQSVAVFRMPQTLVAHSVVDCSSTIETASHTDQSRPDPDDTETDVRRAA